MAIVVAGVIVATGSLAYTTDQINRYGDVPCPSAAAPSGNGASAMSVGFTTMEEIVSNAEAIVVSYVDGCSKVHSHPKSREIRLTDFEVKIVKSVKGNIPVGKTITVQLVTSGEDWDYHLMNTGERYVLFLTFNQITSSYVPVGGPQGRFLIGEGDLVYSLDGIYPDMSFISVKVDGQPLEEFLSGVQSKS